MFSTVVNLFISLHICIDTPEGRANTVLESRREEGLIQHQSESETGEELSDVSHQLDSPGMYTL